MEKRLEELLRKTGTCLSVKEGRELLDSVYKLALRKEAKQSTEDTVKELKKVLGGSKDKEVVNAIQKVLDLVEGGIRL